MANTKQSAKRARQATSRQVFNQSNRSVMRSSIKKIRLAIKEAATSGDYSVCEQPFKEMQSVVDKMARKGIIKPNKAARHKHRLNKIIKQGSLAAPAQNRTTSAPAKKTAEAIKPSVATEAKAEESAAS